MTLGIKSYVIDTLSDKELGLKITFEDATVVNSDDQLEVSHRLFEFEPSLSKEEVFYRFNLIK